MLRAALLIRFSLRVDMSSQPGLNPQEKPRQKQIVTQIIRSDADRTNFMVNPSNFRVEIDTDSTNINFDNLKTINASEIIISNSRIEINDFTDWQNWDKNVDLQGPVYLIVKGAVHNGDIITHAVSGDTVIVEVQGLSGLYRADIVERYYFQRGRVEFMLREDKALRKAMQLIVEN